MKSATERSKERYLRAALTLPKITLDDTQAAKLRALCEHRNETASAVVRSLITAAPLKGKSK